MKRLIVFDLDGTLAESKSSLDAEMSILLHELLNIIKVAVISGGNWSQFEKQLPGIDRRDDLGMPTRFDVYYGMADARIGVARLDLPDILPPEGVADAPNEKV